MIPSKRIICAGVQSTYWSCKTYPNIVHYLLSVWLGIACGNCKLEIWLSHIINDFRSSLVPTFILYWTGLSCWWSIISVNKVILITRKNREVSIFDNLDKVLTSTNRRKRIMDNVMVIRRDELMNQTKFRQNSKKFKTQVAWIF